MDIDDGTLRLESEDFAHGTLMGVELPSASLSGGLLVAEHDSLVFVLFSEEDVQAGDVVRVPPDLRFSVVSARHATLREQPVTVLELRPREDDDPPGGRPVA